MNVLTDRTEIAVKFSEVDSMGVVWHGTYIRYFEDGRESFGKKYGITYMDVYKNHYMAPVTHVECDYKIPLEYGEKALIETSFHDTEAAKIIFTYKIFRLPGMQLAAEGKSIQVFIDKNRELVLNTPGFIYEWKRKWGIIS